MAYATVSDIEARWRELTADEESKAGVLLDDAAAILDTLGVFDPTDATVAANLRTVSCNMVIRAMSASQSDSFGLSQGSMTAGVYTQSWTYSNPSGDMYLTRMEKRLLGITGGYIGSIQPKIEVLGCGCDD